MEESATASMEELKRRLELALKPAERPPALDEVLEEVSRRGALRGPLDWAFPAWIAYVDYAVRKIIETFPLTEEERRQLMHFRDALTCLLLEAWMQARNRLTTLYKAIVEGTYRIGGKRLYAPDGTWMYVSRPPFPPIIPIHGIGANTYFPDILKLPQESLKLLQLGWRASDEGSERNRPTMSTTQPWQLIAWISVRHGEVRIRVVFVYLTQEGVSILVRATAKSWKQQNKEDSIDRVVKYSKDGIWMPLFTMWLGDGSAELSNILRRNRYYLLVGSKNPWKLGRAIGPYSALIASGKEAYAKLWKAAGVYGKLLELLKSHKWISIKLATDDTFRTIYKQQKSGRKWGSNRIVIAGIEMSLRLVISNGGSVWAEYYTTKLEDATEVAKKLEAIGLRPNIIRSGRSYVTYVAMTDLLKLAEENESIRKTIATYLIGRAASGTPKQKEMATKILQRHLHFFPAANYYPSSSTSELSTKLTSLAIPSALERRASPRQDGVASGALRRA
ncbi:MAG: hypothetical protein LM577_03480 [Thermoproteaceae archaeon]|nr:hypothetical protein [Thermoproteaceae archaeon]